MLFLQIERTLAIAADVAAAAAEDPTREILVGSVLIRPVITHVIISDWTLLPNLAGGLPAATGVTRGVTALALTATNIVTVFDYDRKSPGLTGVQVDTFTVV